MRQLLWSIRASLTLAWDLFREWMRGLWMWGLCLLALLVGVYYGGWRQEIVLARGQSPHTQYYWVEIPDTTLTIDVRGQPTLVMLPDTTVQVMIETGNHRMTLDEAAKMRDFLQAWADTVGRDDIPAYGMINH